MAKDDFFLSFGTDANVFADKIVAESSRAENAILDLAQALQTYDTVLSNTKQGGPLNNLFASLDQAATKFGSLTSELVTGFDKALRGVGSLTSELSGLVDAVNKISTASQAKKGKTAKSLGSIGDDDVVAVDQAKKTARALGDIISLNAREARNALKNVADINATLGRNARDAAPQVSELAKQIRDLNTAAKGLKPASGKSGSTSSSSVSSSPGATFINNTPANPVPVFVVGGSGGLPRGHHHFPQQPFPTGPQPLPVIPGRAASIPVARTPFTNTSAATRNPNDVGGVNDTVRYSTEQLRNKLITNLETRAQGQFDVVTQAINSLILERDTRIKAYDKAIKDIQKSKNISPEDKQVRIASKEQDKQQTVDQFNQNISLSQARLGEIRTTVDGFKSVISQYTRDQVQLASNTTKAFEAFVGAIESGSRKALDLVAANFQAGGTFSGLPSTLHKSENLPGTIGSGSSVAKLISDFAAVGGIARELIPNLAKAAQEVKGVKDTIRNEATEQIFHLINQRPDFARSETPAISEFRSVLSAVDAQIVKELGGLKDLPSSLKQILLGAQLRETERLNHVETLIPANKVKSQIGGKYIGALNVLDEIGGKELDPLGLQTLQKKILEGAKSTAGLSQADKEINKAFNQAKKAIQTALDSGVNDVAAECRTALSKLFDLISPKTILQESTPEEKKAAQANKAQLIAEAAAKAQAKKAAAAQAAAETQAAAQPTEVLTRAARNVVPGPTSPAARQQVVQQVERDQQRIAIAKRVEADNSQILANAALAAGTNAERDYTIAASVKEEKTRRLDLEARLERQKIAVAEAQLAYDQQFAKLSPEQLAQHKTLSATADAARGVLDKAEEYHNSVSTPESYAAYEKADNADTIALEALTSFQNSHGINPGLAKENLGYEKKRLEQVQRRLDKTPALNDIEADVTARYMTPAEQARNLNAIRLGEAGFPRGFESRTEADKYVGGLGTRLQGRSLVGAIDSFTTGYAHLHGLDLNSPQYKPLTDAVIASEAGAPQLYRGFNRSSAKSKSDYDAFYTKVLNAQPGEHLDQDIRSFSSSEEISRDTFGASDKPIVYRVAGGAQALNIAPYSNFPHEAEYATGGRFEILRTFIDEFGVLVAELRQVAVGNIADVANHGGILPQLTRDNAGFFNPTDEIREGVYKTNKGISTIRDENYTINNDINDHQYALKNAQNRIKQQELLRSGASTSEPATLARIDAEILTLKQTEAASLAAIAALEKKRTENLEKIVRLEEQVAAYSLTEGPRPVQFPDALQNGLLPGQAGYRANLDALPFNSHQRGLIDSYAVSARGDNSSPNDLVEHLLAQGNSHEQVINRLKTVDQFTHDEAINTVRATAYSRGIPDVAPGASEFDRKTGNFTPSGEFLDYQQRYFSSRGLPLPGQEETINAQQRGGPLRVSDFEQIGGQAGSNEGGLYQHPTTGEQFYIKKPISQSHGEQELLTNEFYRQLGISVPETTRAQFDDGSFGIASRIIPNHQKDLYERLNDPSYKRQVQKGFAADAFLGNRDAIGLVYDNIVSDATGRPVRIDNGGALEYRAGGLPKPTEGPGGFNGSSITELAGLLNPNINAEAAHGYSGISQTQIRLGAQGVLNSLTPERIESLVRSHITDPEEQNRLIQTLQGRRIALSDETGASLPEQPFRPIANPAARGESGDGAVFGPNGERFYGKFGAAGALIRHVDEQGQERFLLGQRGPALSNAGLYSTIGGAIDQYETPQQGAAREISEELGVDPAQLARLHQVGQSRFDHPAGVSYHTLLADHPEQLPIDPSKFDFETSHAAYFTREELLQKKANGELLPAFADKLEEHLDAFTQHDIEQGKGVGPTVAQGSQQVAETASRQLAATIERVVAEAKAEVQANAAPPPFQKGSIAAAIKELNELQKQLAAFADDSEFLTPLIAEKERQITELKAAKKASKKTPVHASTPAAGINYDDIDDLTLANTYEPIPAGGGANVRPALRTVASTGPYGPIPGLIQPADNENVTQQKVQETIHGGGSGGGLPPRPPITGGGGDGPDEPEEPRRRQPNQGIGVFAPVGPGNKASGALVFTTDFAAQIALLKEETQEEFRNGAARLANAKTMQEQVRILTELGALYVQDPLYKTMPNAETRKGTFAQAVGLPATKPNNRLLTELFGEAGSVNASGLVNRTTQGVNEVTGAVNRLTSSHPGGTLGQKLFGQAGFIDSQLRHIGSAIENFAGFQLAFTGFQQLKELVDTGIQADAVFVRLKSNLAATGRDTSTIQSQLVGASSQTAEPITNLENAAAELTGVFPTNAGLVGATKTAGQLALISQGQLTAPQAAIALRDVADAYGIRDAKGIQGIGDTSARVAQLTGVSVKDVLEGSTDLAQEARQFKLGPRASAVLAAEITKNTGEKGPAAAEQLSRIFSQLNDPKVKAALIREGLATQEQFAKGQLGDVITGTMKGFKGLSETGQQEIFKALGSGRQARAFTGILRDSAETSGFLQDSGAGDKGALNTQAAATLQTLAGALKEVDNDFKNLGVTLAQAGVFNILGYAVKALDEFLKVFNATFGQINQFFNNNPILKGLKDMVIVLGEVALAFKVFGSIGGQFLGRVNPGRAMVDAAGSPVARLGASETAALLESKAITAAEARKGVFRNLSTGEQLLADDVKYAPVTYRGAQNAIFNAPRTIANAANPFRFLAPNIPAVGPLTEGQVAAVAAAESGASRGSIGFQAFRANRNALRLARAGAAGFPVEEGGQLALFPAGAAGAAGAGAAAAEEGGMLAKAARNTGDNFKALRTTLSQSAAASGNAVAGIGKFNLAMMGLSVAIPLILSEISTIQDRNKGRDAARDALLGDPNAHQNDLSPKDQAIADSKNAQQKVSFLDVALRNTANVIGQSIFGGNIVGQDSQGLTSDASDKAEGKITNDAFKALRAAVNDKTGTPKQQADRIRAAQTAIDKNIDDHAKKAAEAGGNDANAQTSIYNELNFLKDKIAEAGSKRLAILDGLGQADLLTQDQIDKADTFATASLQLNAATLTKFKDLQSLLKDNTGNTGTALTDLGVINDPNATQGQRLRAQQDRLGIDITNETAALKGGNFGNPGDDTYRAEVQKIQGQEAQYSTLSSQASQADVALGTSKAKQFANTGDVAGQVNALKDQQSSLETYLATLSKNDPAYYDTLGQIQQIKTDIATALSSKAISDLTTKIAGEVDPVTKARDQAAIAAQKLKDAQAGGKIPEIRAATADKAAADIGQAQAEQAQKAAEAQAGYAGTLSRSVQIAAKIAENQRQQIVASQGALQDATKLATLKGEAKDLALQQAQLDQEFTKTQSDLAIAILNARGAAGDSTKAADIEIQQAKQALANFQAGGGTKKDPEFATLQAGIVTATRNRFDVALNAQIDTLDFQKETYKITGTQEVQALQEILKNKQLTLKEQRDITLKIKSLQDSIRQQLTGGGFNIPSDIKLPTAYQVRRSLGGNQGNGGTTVNNVSSATNNVNINNNVPTAQVAQQIAAQVIAVINSQTGQSVRANTSTPRLVGA